MCLCVYNWRINQLWFDFNCEVIVESCWIKLLKGFQHFIDYFIIFASTHSCLINWLHLNFIMALLIEQQLLFDLVILQLALVKLGEFYILHLNLLWQTMQHIINKIASFFAIWFIFFFNKMELKLPKDELTVVRKLRKRSYVWLPFEYQCGFVV